MRCPAESELERFHSGVLREDERVQVATHVTGCTKCRSWLDEASADDALWTDVRQALDAAEPEPAAPAEDARIGEFRLVRRIGEGGMGVVFEAEQDSPRRRVALKLLRAGVASGRALRRFELEAEVLGRLQHPGIARILRAGTFATPAGPQPYFAMELVRGRPLREHARSLDRDGKVRLVAALCDAVHHAHQQGVVHRDLKPENVLADDAGRPVVLDFGVARLAERDAGDAGETQAGQLVGTLPYMSPEQLLGQPDAIDVRTDVRALAVIAFELLGGRLPHDVAALPLPEAARRICEQEPRRLRALAPDCTVDLEVVVHKALAADKAARYGSAAAFGRDLERVLEHLPVEARPATTWYFVRRFARRHRALVGFAAALLLALLLGIAATTWQADRAHAAELAARADQLRAEEDATHARAARDFMQEVLIQASPADAGGKGGPLDKVLEVAMSRVNDGADPLVQAAVRTHGRILVGWGRYAEGRDELLAALALFEQRGERDRKDVAWVLIHLAEAHLRLGGREAAEKCVQRAIALAQAIQPTPYALLATGANALALAHFEARDMPAAEAAFRDAASFYDRTGGDFGALNAAISRTNLARVLVLREQYDEAAVLFEQALGVQRRLLPRSPAVAAALANFAFLFEARGEWPRVRELLAEAHAMTLAAQGDGAPAALLAIRLGVAEHRLGVDGGRERALAGLQTAQRALGEQHPDVRIARKMLGQ
jgi:tetratricopeptide (TPR) repeat protein/predicted Ser/Thr protein kinase